MTEIIYILTNPVMSGLVNIGKTTKLEDRIRNLSSHSGIPVPFEVYYACTVADSNKVESYLHDGFRDHRVNPKREFFRINPERVLSILKLVEIEDITPSDDYVENQEEQQSLNKERKKRSNFSFSSAEVPIGSILTFVRDETITITAVEDKKIEFEGRITSLTQAAIVLLNRNFGKNLSVACGPEFWMFENEILSERRLRLENEDN